MERRRSFARTRPPSAPQARRVGLVRCHGYALCSGRVRTPWPCVVAAAPGRRPRGGRPHGRRGVCWQGPVTGRSCSPLSRCVSCRPLPALRRLRDPLCAPASPVASLVTMDAITGPLGSDSDDQVWLALAPSPTTCVSFCPPLECCGRCSRGAWIVTRFFNQNLNLCFFQVPGCGDRIHPLDRLLLCTLLQASAYMVNQTFPSLRPQAQAPAAHERTP